LRNLKIPKRYFFTWAVGATLLALTIPNLLYVTLELLSFSVSQTINAVEFYPISLITSAKVTVHYYVYNRNCTRFITLYAS